MWRFGLNSGGAQQKETRQGHKSAFNVHGCVGNLSHTSQKWWRHFIRITAILYTRRAPMNHLTLTPLMIDPFLHFLPAFLPFPVSASFSQLMTHCRTFRSYSSLIIYHIHPPIRYINHKHTCSMSTDNHVLPLRHLTQLLLLFFTHKDPKKYLLI